MVDYDKASANGTLRIRDLGSTVEFWVKPYYSDFWWDNLSFTRIVNGSTTNFTYDIRGNAWVRVATATVTTSQTVTFKLNTATGTSSLGGPTTHAVYLDRGTLPPTPNSPTTSLVEDTTMTVSFTNNGNGGLALSDWAIALGTDPTPGNTYYPGADQSMPFTGLVAGTKYYMWARVRNSKGWSSWSARSEVTMKRVPFQPSSISSSDVGQDSVKITFVDGSDGGSAITSRDIAYNTTNSPVGGTIISANNSETITGLEPGRVYYFFARTKNKYGNGEWSVSLAVQLNAGAYIFVDGVARRAVPWVNDNGVWKVSKPWIKVNGTWIRSL